MSEMAKESSFYSRQRKEIFSPLHSFQTGVGAHPASYQTFARGSFLGGKAAGTEADHSPIQF
jgi:hypothetical protein